MRRSIYFFGEDGKRHGRQQLPTWVNQPHKADRDPEWDLDVCPPGPLISPINAVSWFGSGLPPFSEVPRFVYEHPMDGLPFLDIVRLARGLLLLSEKTKVAFERIDPAAFVFQAVETFVDNGEPGPRSWLCDVVRFLDALDEKRSPSAIVSVAEYKRPLPQIAPRFVRIAHHSLCGDEVFKGAVIGDHHIFRECHQTWNIFFDERIASAMRKTSLIGVRPALLLGSIE